MEEIISYYFLRATAKNCYIKTYVSNLRVLSENACNVLRESNFKFLTFLILKLVRILNIYMEFLFYTEYLKIIFRMEKDVFRFLYLFCFITFISCKCSIKSLFELETLKKFVILF